MDKLKKQIEDANSNIKQTEKLLDVDIFLKQQKKKRLEYAKNLNSDFEEQKKLRQAKLYKKHNREKKQEENKNNEKIEFKIQNFRALMPLDIVKVLSNERREKKFIKQGHHYRLSDLNVQDYEGIHEEESIMFENLKHNKQTDKMKYDGDSESKHIVWKNVKQIVENCLQMKNLPIIVNEGELLPTMEY